MILCLSAVGPFSKAKLMMQSFSIHAPIGYDGVLRTLSFPSFFPSAFAFLSTFTITTSPPLRPSCFHFASCVFVIDSARCFALGIVLVR